MASDAARCGALTKSGKPCQRSAKDQGRCGLHKDSEPVRSGAELRAAIESEYQLSRHETEVLHQVCDTLDTILELEAAVNEHGTMVVGSKGQQVLNPAIPELRQQRLAIGRLLAQLRLPVDGGQELASPESVRARMAAQARWSMRDSVDAERSALGRESVLPKLRAVDPAGA